MAVTRGSFWRSEPAAALRGLANTGLPASVIDSFSRSNASRGRNTSPRTSSSAGTGNSSVPDQPVRHRGDGLDVGRDVLAGAAVAAGEGPDQATVLVEQVDGQTVDLELAQQRGRRDVLATEAGVPRLELGVGERVVERLHPLEVVDRGELRRDRAADLLGRRVGGAELGELLLEALQLAQPDVVLRVGQRRVVQHEVAPAGVLDLLHDRRVLLPGLWGDRRDGGDGGELVVHGTILPGPTPIRMPRRSGPLAAPRARPGKFLRSFSRLWECASPGYGSR